MSNLVGNPEDRFSHNEAHIIVHNDMKLCRLTTEQIRWVFHDNFSRVMRKPVFGVSNQVKHKPGCTATEDCLSLEILDLGRRGIVLCSKNKVADQLRLLCRSAAPLFSHLQKAGFFMKQLI